MGVSGRHLTVLHRSFNLILRRDQGEAVPGVTLKRTEEDDFQCYGSEASMICNVLKQSREARNVNVMCTQAQKLELCRWEVTYG